MGISFGFCSPISGGMPHWRRNQNLQVLLLRYRVEAQVICIMN